MRSILRLPLPVIVAAAVVAFIAMPPLAQVAYAAPKTAQKKAPVKRVSPPSQRAAPNDARFAIDVESGRELEAFAADELRHPASLTKMMTLYLTFAALDSGTLRLTQRLPVSRRATSQQPSKMDAREYLLVRDAIMGLVTRSANDAAVVLAEGVAADEDEFARRMTRKARELGMASTTFRNASGLPDPQQLTTARDMATLARALLRDFPHYYPLFATQDFVYEGRTLSNHNRMLGWYPGADGLKTGYIRLSGFNLALSAMRDGRRVVGVVMGGDSARLRDTDMAAMMDRAFDDARRLRLPAWTQPATPSSARYLAAHFAPAVPVEPGRGAVAVAAAPPAAPAAPEPKAAMGSSPAPSGSATSRWSIQLGAFASQKAAINALGRGVALAPDLKREAQQSIMETQIGGKNLWRARFTGLDEAQAARVCQKLQAQKMSCSPIDPEGPLQN